MQLGVFSIDMFTKLYKLRVINFIIIADIHFKREYSNER